MTTATRDTRLSLRLTGEHNSLIRAAAAHQGVTVTDFTTIAALAEARRVLVDQVLVGLGEQAWDVFVDALDHPAPSPRFDRLMSEPSVFEQ